MVKIGSETAPEMKRTFVPVYCTEHPEKALDYYCADCKKIVCVSCFVEGHASHICKDVTKANKEFRQTIQNESSKVSIYADDMFSLRKKAEIRKAEFLQEMIDTEDAIRKRNQELKEMIDEHTKLLLDELSKIKSKNLKEMETRMQEIDRYDTIFRSFEAFCTGLISKGSPRDICSSFDQLIARAKELEMGHEIVIFRESLLIEVSFQTSVFRRGSQMCGNLLGQLKGMVFLKILIQLYDSLNRTTIIVDFRSALEFCIVAFSCFMISVRISSGSELNRLKFSKCMQATINNY